MTTKVNFIFCLVFVTWTLASAKIYKVVHPRELSAASCGYNRMPKMTSPLALDSNPVDDYPYEAWNDKTIIKALGSYTYGTSLTRFYDPEPTESFTELELHMSASLKVQKVFSVWFTAPEEEEYGRHLSVMLVVDKPHNGIMLFNQVDHSHSGSWKCAYITSNITQIEIDNSANE